MTRIFFSCVTAQFGNDRIMLKDTFGKAGLELCVQEDFAESGSAYGTLLKIYGYIKKADLVVQLIGSHQSQKVPKAVCNEVLRVLPDFRRWLAQKGLLSALQDGDIGYLDFEGFASLYLRKELVLIRFGSGAQSDYEPRLRKLGRHVEAKCDKLTELLPRVQAQLAEIKIIDRASAQHTERKVLRVLNALWMFAIAVCFGVVFLIQLDLSGALQTMDPPQVLRQLAYLLAVSGAAVLFQSLIMTDTLSFGFRLEIAIRNWFVGLLIATLCAYAAFKTMALAETLNTSWTTLITISILLTVISFWFKPPQNKGVGVWLLSFLLNVAFCILVLVLWANLARFPIELFWSFVTLGFAILIRSTWQDNKELELEIEHGTSDLSEGVTARNSQFFWVARQTVMDARRQEDLGSDFPRY